MEETNSEFQRALSLLKNSHTWPGDYLFKFIVPIQHKTILLEQLEMHELVDEKASRSGKYASLTVRKHFQAPQDVIKTYQRVKTIEGLIAL